MSPYVPPTIACLQLPVHIQKTKIIPACRDLVFSLRKKCSLQHNWSFYVVVKLMGIETKQYSPST